MMISLPNSYEQNLGVRNKDQSPTALVLGIRNLQHYHCAGDDMFKARTLLATTKYGAVSHWIWTTIELVDRLHLR